MSDINKGEKMLHDSPSTGDWLWLAQIISRWSNPIYLAPPLFLTVSLATAPNVARGLLWWLIISVGVTVVPILFIRRGVSKGHYTDVHVSRREQRSIPLLFGVVCLIVILLLLVILNASYELIGTMIATILSLAIALVITQFARWKISLHQIGITGAVTTLVYFYGTPFIWLTPLIVIIGWSRWKVNAHTLLQICAGTILGGSVTMIIFWLFGSL